MAVVTMDNILMVNKIATRVFFLRDGGVYNEGWKKWKAVWMKGVVDFKYPIYL